MYWNSERTDWVLIVAKCIVNYSFGLVVRIITFVLIVAKCIVNKCFGGTNRKENLVLIVAKCIVNLFHCLLTIHIILY